MDEVCVCPELAAAVDANGNHMGCGRPMAKSYELFCGECGAVEGEPFPAPPELKRCAMDAHHWMKRPAS